MPVTPDYFIGPIFTAIALTVVLRLVSLLSRRYLGLIVSNNESMVAVLVGLGLLNLTSSNHSVWRASAVILTVAVMLFCKKALESRQADRDRVTRESVRDSGRS